jgi:hypothetical protein
MKSGIVKIVFLSAFLVVLACEKEIAWKLQSDNEQRIVIDAIITGERERQKVYISLTNPGMNQAIQPVSGLEVSVSTGDTSFLFTESPEESGLYISSEFRAVVQREYLLIVNHQGLIYQARAQAEPVARLGRLTLQWNADKQLYRYVPNETGSPAMTEILYNWSGNDGYCSVYGSCLAQETVYILENVDVNDQFGPETDIIYFPKGTVIHRRKYSLTDQHQNFIRSLLMETAWRGGLFDVQQGNVPSNISNGALGFFAVCMVDADSATVD